MLALALVPLAGWLGWLGFHAVVEVVDYIREEES